MRMAAYCRVSTEKEEQLSSLENQREFFEQYADKEGDTLVKIYADEGISGKSMNKREAFTQLLEDSKTGKVLGISHWDDPDDYLNMNDYEVKWQD